MTDTPTEPATGPAVPEPSPLETVARLAAEAVIRALPPAPPEERLAAVEASLQEILAALAAAAGPEGNAAKLSARLDAAEQQLAELTARPVPANPKQQQLIDDLRLKIATLERKL